MYFGGSSRAQYKSISFFGEVDPPPAPPPLIPTYLNSELSF